MAENSFLIFMAHTHLYCILTSVGKPHQPINHKSQQNSQTPKIILCWFLVNRMGFQSSINRTLLQRFPQDLYETISDNL